jgi:F-type H+-transporting ATPase subunit b
MLIDWFTIGAQAFNFVILVWLMKRFLYKPILKAIDERENLIATKLANAKSKLSDAQLKSDEFRQKTEEFDRQRSSLLSKATDEANTERQRLLDEARNDAAALAAKRQETLLNDKQNMLQDFSGRTRREVFAIARKALTDLAGTSLEERCIDVFMHRVRTMDDHARGIFTQALTATSAPALVRSTFDLSATQRTSLQNALNETFAAEIRIRFETEPDLIGGIELIANGHKVAWSIADYLATLEKSIDTFLKDQERPPSGTVFTPEEPAAKEKVVEHGA